MSYGIGATYIKMIFPTPHHIMTFLKVIMRAPSALLIFTAITTSDDATCKKLYEWIFWGKQKRNYQAVQN